MSTLRIILGVLLIVGGILLGLYVGLWVCFIGGIVQVINAIKNDANAMGIALGIVRIVSASFVGILTFYILAAIGAGMLKLKLTTKRRK